MYHPIGLLLEQTLQTRLQLCTSSPPGLAQNAVVQIFMNDLAWITKVNSTNQWFR